MMTMKFRNELVTSILEYIALRMMAIRDKYNEEELVGSEGSLKWWRCSLHNVCCNVIEVIDINEDEVIRFPHVKTFEMLAEEPVITSAHWDFVEMCMNDVEEFVDSLYEKAREEEKRIEAELEKSPAYRGYKAMKFVDKIEEKNR